MTFDSVPDWPQATELTTNLPPHCGPTLTSLSELAALISELFAEGSLSWEQLRALAGVPELQPLLDQAIAAIPPTRKIAR